MGLLWVAWRGQRAQFAAIAALLLLYGAAALVERSEPELTGLTGQLAGFLPGAVCLVWGAPLIARELETGTFKLAWAQSVTRGRWLAAILASAAAGALAATGTLAALLTWALPDAGGDPMAWPHYESHGIVPFARVVFALTLGAALGAVTGHSRVAMPLAVLLVGVSQLGGRAMRGQFHLSYWPMQSAEAAAYVGITVFLTGIAYLAIRRRA
ncbi:ABC transporter permease subunit [Dactylosporangium sp. NBC_01737]|uniref:ABC transporter permease subunit n=1 Tax=Dactylosporangium sp. NBC_01737 TaxID=2975959 RepID=UPI002E103259|nr:ABC transporter permease subunit [Dactylosporangium sp. NBC_01737]